MKSFLSLLFASLTVFSLNASDQNVNAQNTPIKPESFPVSICFPPKEVCPKPCFNNSASAQNTPFDANQTVQQNVDDFKEIFNKWKIYCTSTDSLKTIDLLIERLDLIALKNETAHKKVELLHLKELAEFTTMICETVKIQTSNISS